MAPHRRSFIGLVFLLAATALSGCVFLIHSTKHPLEEADSQAVTEVRTPIRAHLADGGVVVFRNGAWVGPDSVTGHGWRYDLPRLDSTPVVGIPMTQVVGLEATPISALDVPESILVSAGATSLALVGASALAVAIFGSCPTVYATDGTTETLEAELFSYSIAPLLEGRDVDALDAAAHQGVVRLDVRDEALESHFLNQVELLEVRQDTGEQTVRDGTGRPVVVAALTPPSSAHDRDGRDVRRLLAARDGEAFATSTARLETALAGDLGDEIELVFQAPAGGRHEGAPGDSVALVLRLRNSLLNTVLFYDMMLARSGLASLSWLGTDLQRIGPAVALGGWWSGRMGLRVDVLRGDTWTEVTRVADTGPIAWSDVGVPIERTAADSVRIRLRFVADEWRIDRAVLAWSVRTPPARIHPVSRLLDASGQPLPGGIDAVAAPDEGYLESRPGDRFTLEFEVGPEPDHGSRSFLLSSQGYYTEWIRPSWVRQAAAQGIQPLRVGDDLLRQAMRRWGARRPEFEREFFTSRIPTR